MNTLLKSVSGLASKFILSANTVMPTSVMSTSFMPKRFLPTLLRMHQRNLERLANPPRKKKSPLDGKPFAKGIVIKTLIKKPRKPNSANRKCVLVRLSTKKEMIAYVPGEGHNLQEHQTVLCKVARLKDTPSVKLKCVRGKYDLPHVKSQK